MNKYNDKDLLQNIKYVKELAQKNPLDMDIYNFCRETFTDTETAEDFLDRFVLPSAKEKKCLTDYRQKKRKTLQKIKQAAEQKQKEADRKQRIAEREAEKQILPEWILVDENGRQRLDEAVFIKSYSSIHQLKYFSGCFYGVDGLITNLAISQNVQGILSEYFTEKLAQTTRHIIEGLQNHCYCKDVEPQTDRIHIKNGFLKADKNGLFTEFVPHKEFCLNRLNVTFPEKKQTPKRFLSFLDELFKPEDIRTVQQYLGYCLLPTNRLQVCLILNGTGGEGKSQLGHIVANILGEENIIQCNIQKVQERFGMANCANKLVYLDDDLDGKALVKTGNFKSLVTSKEKLEAEVKGVQQNTGQFYVRFLCLGNNPLQSLYDQSDGFHRRRLILVVKPRDKSRKTVYDLGDIILKEEKEAVFQWMVDGLNDLIASEWKLYVSESSRAISDALKRDSDTVDIFFMDNPDIILGQGGEMHTTAIYNEYVYFCGDNALKPVSEVGFSRIISERQNQYKIKRVDQLTVHGKRARGYRGVRFKKVHTTSISKCIGNNSEDLSVVVNDSTEHSNDDLRAAV